MTGGRVTAAALVLVLSAGSAACGGSSKKNEMADTTTSSTSTSLPNVTAPVDPATGKQAKVRPTDRYSATAPPPAGFRGADGTPQQGAVPLAASTSPSCVEHGQELTVVFKSDPGMTVAAQIKWPNEQFSGLDNTRGTTSADGTLTWKVPVKPSALFGQAEVMAAAIDSKNGQRSGSSGGWQFVVAAPGRC